jgi:hypothetical protein
MKPLDLVLGRRVARSMIHVSFILFVILNLQYWLFREQLIQRTCIIIGAVPQ